MDDPPDIDKAMDTILSELTCVPNAKFPDNFIRLKRPKEPNLRPHPSPPLLLKTAHPSSPAAAGHLSTLPAELLHLILSHLDFRSLCRLMQTCHFAHASIASLPAYFRPLQLHPKLLLVLRQTGLLPHHACSTVLSALLDPPTCAFCHENVDLYENLNDATDVAAAAAHPPYSAAADDDDYYNDNRGVSVSASGDGGGGGGGTSGGSGSANGGASNDPFAPAIFLPTCTRTCLICALDNPSTRLMTPQLARMAFALTPHALAPLPLLVTRQRYLPRRTLRLVSRRAAHAVGVRVYGGEERMWEAAEAGVDEWSEEEEVVGNKGDWLESDGLWNRRVEGILKGALGGSTSRHRHHGEMGSLMVPVFRRRRRRGGQMQTRELQQQQQQQQRDERAVGGTRGDGPAAVTGERKGKGRGDGKGKGKREEGKGKKQERENEEAQSPYWCFACFNQHTMRVSMDTPGVPYTGPSFASEPDSMQYFVQNRARLPPDRDHFDYLLRRALRARPRERMVEHLLRCEPTRYVYREAWRRLVNIVEVKRAINGGQESGSG